MAAAMTLSDLSIRRPVFATVLSLLLVILGCMAALRLPVRELPDVTAPVVGISTSYRGASADIIESRITQVLENELAGVEGIDKLSSSSRDGSSSITIEFDVGRDLDAAANDVRERVARVVARLPEDADPPQISKTGESTDPVLMLAVSSSRRSDLELSDYVERYLNDPLAAIPGVAQVRGGGTRRYAMRIWLDRQAMAARQITVADVTGALRTQNVQLPSGRIESQQREFSVRTDMSFRTPAEFENLVLTHGGDGYLVRLRDIASVQLGAEDARTIARSDGKPTVMMMLVPQSTANVLQVAQAAKAEVAALQAQLPEDITLKVQVDNSAFIIASMEKVMRALLETLVIVLVVIYLFLGSLRAMIIPAVTIPVSILAAATVMAALGYSLNTVTLLGAVLAIGLVVDDAIVVLENIVRRAEHGEPGLLAAMNGAREIGFAVIATTLVLIAVFLPISYLQGTIGRMFSEFGVTIAAAVGFSALVALTLTPMMCSKLFANGVQRGRLASAVDNAFQRVAQRYRRWLSAALSGRRPFWILASTGAVAASVIALLLLGWPFAAARLPQELTPSEDRGAIRVMVTGIEGASLTYMDDKFKQVEDFARSEMDRGNVRNVLARVGGGNGGNVSSDVNSGMVMVRLVDWNRRNESAEQIAERLRREMAGIPGVRAFPTLPSAFAQRSGNSPVQVVLEGPDYATVSGWSDQVMARIARDNPRILNLDSDYKERKPQLYVQVDRNRAADLGVPMDSIGSTLETMMGSSTVTTYISGGREYNVMLQARDDQRATVSDLDNIYVRGTASASSAAPVVPLASVVQINEQAGPTELKRFNRQRAVTISATLAPGYALGDALQYIERVVHEEIHEGTPQIDYDGQSRELKRSSSGLLQTFGFALLIVYLVLAAQFESFVHPIVILASVPMALVGALLGLVIFGSSLNVYSQIGLVMLVGIASKNGILIVEFANQLRDRGTEFVQATIEAATTRLRPVLMTSLATAVGAVPLVIATGAGAESRRSIGATVFCGLILAVLLTMFVVPALYTLIARRTRSASYVSRLLDQQRQQDPG
ncbi:MAG: efflux RND transporter permease subunit [Steroidobacteraceae bacterium]